MTKTTWFLKQCDLFENLTPEQEGRLQRHALVRKFKKGEMIYFPTDSTESVLVVTGGRVLIKSITLDGKETILAFIEEGEVFGEQALLDVRIREEYAQAAEDTQVLLISRDDLVWLIEQRPDVALNITKLLGLRKKRIENRLRNILFHSNHERLSSLLLELAETHGKRRGDHWEIGLLLTHHELASLIGAARETVTLALGKLQFQRLIQIRRRRITILDREGLAAQANGLVAST